MALKSDAKIEGKLTCAFQNDIRNLSNFHRLKNSDFILENKPSRNKNSKHLDRPDAVRKLYFTWERIAQLTKHFTHVLQNRCS